MRLVDAIGRCDWLMLLIDVVANDQSSMRLVKNKKKRPEARAGPAF